MIELDKKILVFTDLHFGIHANSQSYIDICKNTMSWIKDYSLKNDIHNVLFMGDFFDSRASIDIKTLNAATESLYDLANSGISIALILGNHDIYLRDSTSIHSLFAFNGHKGISIIDKPIITSVGESDVAILPWQYGTESGEHIQISEKLSYVFCHHNYPADFFLGGNTKKKKHSDTYVDKNKYVEQYGFQSGIVETVIKNGGAIYSGHIHQRIEFPIGDSSCMVIAGSPYETSWGFHGVECGAYVVDIPNKHHEFIANPHNKSHVNIRTSSVDKDFDVVFKEIGASKVIVRLLVDTQESFDTISKIQASIKQQNPYAVENTKYEFSLAEFVGKNENEYINNSADNITHSVSSKLDYVKSAIDNYDFTSFAYMKGEETMTIDKNKLKELATELFEKGK